MKHRILMSVALLFAVIGTAVAQETESKEVTLFELSFNNYGPSVRLFTRDGVLMKYVNSGNINRYSFPEPPPKIHEEGLKRVREVEIGRYAQLVGDSVIDKLYPLLKKDVKKKKREDKKWAKAWAKKEKREAKEWAKKNGKKSWKLMPVEHRNGGRMISLGINMRGVKYETSYTLDKKRDQYARWFWEDMQKVYKEILEVKGELPPSTIDELSEHGAVELHYKHDLFAIPLFFEGKWDN